MRKIKGFTLIECIIAIAILGIASLTMAEIYAGVSRTNLNNNLVNTSLSYQMEKVEEKTGGAADTIKIEKYDPADSATQSLVTNNPTKPPHKLDNSNPQKVRNIRITKLDSSGNPINDESYSYPVDTYVLLSRDKDNKPSSDSTSDLYNKEKDINLRYKFIIGS